MGNRARGGAARSVTDVPKVQAIVSWHAVLVHGGSSGPCFGPSFPPDPRLKGFLVQAM